MSSFPRFTLAADEVHVWFVMTDEMREPERLSAYLAMLSHEERERQARFHFEKDRHRFLVSHALVRTMLSRYEEVAPSAWTFTTNAYGRPEIAAPPEHGGLRFNLSHTDGMAAIAISVSREVGVDVESLAREPVARDVADRYFSQIEVEALQRDPEDRRHRAFLELWTLKESYIKARGMGLALPLDKFSFHRHERRPPTISFAPDLDDDPATWLFAQLRPTLDHLLAVAVRREPGRDVAVTLRETVPPA